MFNSSQIPLAIQLPDDESFENFISAQNDYELELIRRFIGGETTTTSLFLFGQRGTGKSHLLNACCVQAEQLGLSSVVLPLAEILAFPVEVLDGIEAMQLICIDNIQILQSSPTWQEAIFDLFNRVLEQGNRLIMTGNDTPDQLGLTLPDLVSRLQWGETIQLKTLSDDQKVTLIRQRAAKRGIDLTVDVASYLITRQSRDLKDLMQCLDQLDRASIREQRKITIPFIKQVLAA